MIKYFLTTTLCAAFLCNTFSAPTKHRKIGLVLGGGGALGFAHVGVLKELEAMHIPIDYIAGTSMGANVAGMYASGMSPEEIEHQFTSLNWWEVLKDKSPHHYLTYRRKFDNKRYMGAEFGLKNLKLQFSPGMAYGQKLNNVIETFALNSDGITDFDHLNIPYRAIATDLRSGTSVPLKSGNLATVMRASMAVPGAFTPVYIDDMVLVDGGILNNIPVDVVKNMGADIIIAVDVGASSAEKTEQSDFRKLGDVLSRTYTIMQRPDQEDQLSRADLVITPNLSNASATQFHQSKKIIPQGQKATRNLAKQLEPYAVDDETYAAFLKKQRFKHSPNINITDIKINGNNRIPETVIRSRIKTEVGPFELNQIYRDIGRIHGMGHFQTVTYNLDPSPNGYTLHYYTDEKFWGPTFLHFGLKFELATDESFLWSMLLNYTATELNALGGEIRMDVSGGGRKNFINAEYYQPIAPSRRLFIAASANASTDDIEIYQGNSVIADLEERIAYGKLDFGISGFEYGEFRIGLLGGHAYDEAHRGLISFPEVSDSVIGVTTQLRLDQLDDPIFPSSGYQFKIDGLFTSKEVGSSKTFSQLEMSLKKPFSFGRHTLTPKIAAGTSFNSELPLYALFNIGGINNFAGYAPFQLYGNVYAVSSIEHRYRLAKLPPTLGNGIYSLFRVDVGNAWDNPNEIDVDNLVTGGLVGLAADTIAGTCTLAIGKAEKTDAPRFYFAIGNNF